MEVARFPIPVAPFATRSQLGTVSLVSSSTICLAHRNGHGCIRPGPAVLSRSSPDVHVAAVRFRTAGPTSSIASFETSGARRCHDAGPPTDRPHCKRSLKPMRRSSLYSNIPSEQGRANSRQSAVHRLAVLLGILVDKTRASAVESHNGHCSPPLPATL